MDWSAWLNALRPGSSCPWARMLPAEVQDLARTVGVPTFRSGPPVACLRTPWATLGISSPCSPRHRSTHGGSTGHSAAPHLFSRTVGRMLDSCAPATRRLVEAVSVLDDLAVLSTAAALVGVDEPLDAVEEACRAGLLATPQPVPAWRLAFPDPLVRAAVYGQLTAERRARLHLAAAALVDDEGAARHHRNLATGGRTGDGPTDQGAAWCPATAHRAGERPMTTSGEGHGNRLMDVVAAEGRELEATFGRIESGTAEPAERRQLADQLLQRLAGHVAVRREVLYPRVSQARSRRRHPRRPRAPRAGPDRADEQGDRRPDGCGAHLRPARRQARDGGLGAPRRGGGGRPARARGRDRGRRGERAGRRPRPGRQHRGAVAH